MKYTLSLKRKIDSIFLKEGQHSKKYRREKLLYIALLLLFI